MGFAYSGGPIVWRQNMDGSTPASLISALDSVAVDAGMTARTAITDGWKYSMLSPQGLTGKVKIYQSAAAVVRVQFMSSDESRVGYPHFLLTDAGRLYQAHANPCQMLISRPGIMRVSGASCQGGIPFVPETTISCADETITTYEAWWSASELRFVHFTSDEWTGCLNSVTGGNAIDNTSINRLRLAVTCLAFGPDFFFGEFQRTRHYGSGPTIYSDKPLYVEPIIVWNGKARGQLYDSLMPTLDRPIDFSDILTDHETGLSYSFVNYMHDDVLTETRHGCLYLLKQPTTVTPSEGAYVY